MAKIIEFKEKSKRRFKFSPKTKTVKILALIIILFFISIAVGFIVLSTDEKPKQNDKFGNKTIEDALKSQIEPNRASNLEKYDQALSLYGKEDFSGSIKLLDEEMKNKKIDIDIQPSYYALIYNCYLKINQLEAAKGAIIQFKETQSYQTLEQSTKDHWGYQLKILEEGGKPDPNAGSKNE